MYLYISFFVTLCILFSSRTNAQETVTHAVAVLTPTTNFTAYGIVRFEQLPNGVHVLGRVEGLVPLSIHGYHVHIGGDVSNKDGLGSGLHFNPLDIPHGCTPNTNRHAGDIGNLQANEAGVAILDVVDNLLPLNFPGFKSQTILGRSLIVHTGPDDCVSQPAGNAGVRIAQGVVGVCILDCTPGHPSSWELSKPYRF